MAVATQSEFLEALRQSRLLKPAQLEEVSRKVQGTSVDLRLVGRKLIEIGWLTPFQVNQLLQGRGRELSLGSYVLLDRLGKGGMGQVFKARHLKMDRVVALKMLTPKSAIAVQRFQREVQAAAKLNHANIVAAHDADEANGVHFLVMEYVDGNDLYHLVKTQGPLPVPQAIDCVLQAARGLEHAHAAGIVHRDIKPGNLLLDRKGVVKVLDMGLARIGGAEEVALGDQLTQDGSILGTCDYIPPEQALNTKNADARSDIYSLGCTLFYLLTGQMMYRGDTAMQKVMAHQQEPIPPLRPLRPEVPAELEAVYRRMVAKKPQDRYPSMRQLIGELELCLPPGADTFSDGSGSPTLRKTASRSTLVGRRAAGGLLAVVGGLGRGLRRIVQLVWSGFRRLSPRWQLGIAATALLTVVLAALFVLTSGDKSGQPSPDDPDGPPPVVEHLPHWVDKEWIGSVAGLPPQEQAKAVAAKLAERNPGFDARFFTPLISYGKVIELDIRTQVTDISPVRALPDLETLKCNWNFNGTGQLADLSPLAGTKLKHLECYNTQVFDLTPLRRLPLIHLNCNGTRVQDLKPLRGMPLQVLKISRTPIITLEPLQGMALTELDCSLTPVIDLGPVKGMPLTRLDCNSTSVTTLEPLRGMALAHLNFMRTRVSDLSPLRDMPLVDLWGNFNYQRQEDLDVIRSLKSLLSFNGRPVAEFWKQVEALPNPR